MYPRMGNGKLRAQRRENQMQRALLENASANEPRAHLLLQANVPAQTGHEVFSDAPQTKPLGRSHQCHRLLADNGLDFRPALFVDEYRCMMTRKWSPEPSWECLRPNLAPRTSSRKVCRPSLNGTCWCLARRGEIFCLSNKM
jgi:hypothetical protein